MANNIVRMPAEFFGDPNQNRPIFFGSIFIGEPDLDPEVEINRKTVTLRQEDGTEVPIAPEAQPLLTGGGGYVLYNGSPVSVLVDGNYSIKVLAKNGDQEFYFDNVLDGAPVTVTDLLAAEYFVKKFDTLALAVADTDLVDGDALNIAERTTGNGGGGMLDVISGTGTANTFNIIAHDTLSLSSVIREDNVIDLRRYGALEASDITAELNQAIANLVAKGGGTIEIDLTTFDISSTVIVESGIVIDFLQAEARPTIASLSMFEVRPGGQLKNSRFSGEQAATGLGAFTGTFATLIGDGGASNGYQGTNLKPWLDGFIGKIDLDQDSGFHVYLDGRQQFLQEFTANNVSTRGGADGLRLEGDETDPSNLEYVQGNLFNGYVSAGCRRFINSVGTATAGNVYTGVILQQRRPTPIGEIVLESSSNIITGFGWDDIVLNITNDGNDLSGFQQNIENGAAITDTGADTRYRTRGVNYYDKTSINTEDDSRRELRGQGRIEFRDHILGGVDPRWTETLTATGTSTFSFNTFGAATGFKQNTSAMDISLTAASDAVTYNFNGLRFLMTVQEPKVHFETYTNVGSDLRLEWQSGLYGGANDYIYLEQSFSKYADANIRLVCAKNGTETVAILVNGAVSGTSGSNRVYTCSIRISSTSVAAKVKEYNNGGTGATGRVADGVSWSDSDDTLFQATITTNIPDDESLEPYVNASRPGGGSNGFLQLLNYSVVAGEKAVS